MTVLRHLVGTPFRTALLSQLDKVFNERVLLGAGVGSQETLRFVALSLSRSYRPLKAISRPQAYAAVADLVYHLRTELSPAHLARITHVYSRLMHNPYLTGNLHTLFAKMMFNLIEIIANKDTPQNAGRLLGAILETCVDKLDAMTAVQEELERMKKGENDKVDISLIERARPVAGAVYAVEKPEEAVHGQ
jgi:transformation/transcription domain-associated protein